MIYKPQHNYCRDFCKFEINKLKGRSFFIPFDCAENALNTPYYEAIERSSKIIALDGEWDFKYYPDYHSLEELDCDSVVFDKVTVPSCWQNTGVEPPFYVNVRYQFPANPPYIPDSFSLGVYRKRFTVETLSEAYILTFLGVSGAMTVYVNGSFVGYSEGSHNTAEFDLSKLLVQGDNELVVMLYKFSNGTYLEAQDMFRSNGIFRSTYIHCLHKEFIYDFKAVSAKNEDGTYNLTVTLFGTHLEMGDYAMKLLDENGNSLTEQVFPKLNHTLTIKDLAVKEWTAETPNLYKIVLLTSLLGQSRSAIATSFGFKTVTVDGEIFKVNGKPIKMLGVNHHDTHPIRGYAMTYADMLLDVTLIKSLNMNTVRTSHYPPHPYFIQMASEIGLYIIDEADIETHGMNYAKCFKNINSISNNPKWASHYVDRVDRMYERDKNAACVTMWSLGNESGGYKNHDLCYDMLRAKSSIPIHYEAASRTKRWAYDVVSHMYADHNACRKIGQHTHNKKYLGKPFFQCEYSHAMGVGPGGLFEYVDIYLQYDNLLGGCIWEWADHAAYKATAKYELSYGGDHGEFVHDGNFCCDGLVSPFRELHPAAIATRDAYRPIRAERLEDGTFRFKNIRVFTDTSDIKVTYSYLKEGVAVDEGELELILQPQGVEEVTIGGVAPTKGNAHVTFTYTDKASGKEIAKEQIELSSAVTQIAPAAKYIWSKSEDEKFIVLSTALTKVVFDKTHNCINSITHKGKALLKPTATRYGEGIVENVWRAPLDNDRNIQRFWRMMGYYQPTYRGISITTAEVADCFKLTVTKYAAYKHRRTHNLSTTYTFEADGSITVQANYSPTMPKLSTLPKFGMILPLAEEFENIEYFGRGDTENYSDIKLHAPVGIYKSDADGMAYPHIFPQEGGCRSDVRWAKVTNENGDGIMVEAADKLLYVNLTPYELENITDAGHREDLRRTGSNFFYVDGFMNGVGTNSCGPCPEKQFQLRANGTLQYSYRLFFI